MSAIIYTNVIMLYIINRNKFGMLSIAVGTTWGIFLNSKKCFPVQPHLLFVAIHVVGWYVWHFILHSRRNSIGRSMIEIQVGVKSI